MIHDEAFAQYVSVLTKNDNIVLSNIIRMAKQLNMDVVTEGVETWQQVEFLHDITKVVDYIE